MPYISVRRAKLIPLYKYSGLSDLFLLDLKTVKNNLKNEFVHFLLVTFLSFAFMAEAESNQTAALP